MKINLLYYIYLYYIINKKVISNNYEKTLKVFYNYIL